MTRWILAGTALLLALVVAGGCSTPNPSSAAGATAAPAPTGPQPAPAGAATEGLVAATVTVPPGLGEDPLDVPRQAMIPAGWSIAVWARVDGARMAAWAPDGALLISRPGSGEVVRLVPGPNGPRQSTLVDGLTQPHGMAFTGNTLYIAESNAVRSYPYQGASLGPATTVVDGLPDARSPELGGRYAHALKSVAIGPDGAVYVSVGSTGNVSPEDRDANPQRASILRIPPGGGPAEVYARGVRNGTGLAVAPDGAVWTAVNNRDNIAFPYHQPYGDAQDAFGQVIPDYVDDHPPEELARLFPGRDLGWPFCNPDIDVQPGVPDSAVDPSDPPFVRDAQTNADGHALDCGTLRPIEQTMGAHSAPLGLSFGAQLPAPWGQGALVGVHGSWNRQSPRAPEVSFYPWQNGTLGGQRTLVGGFQAPDGSRWGRPVAAVQGPDGAVYVTDDDAGAVYRLSPPSQ